jgi:hypothetical protein
MKYFYDTEFLEDGQTIELISIGIVCQDGREYYAINRDAPWQRIQKDEWLMKNVMPSLNVFTLEGSFNRYLTTPKEDIADQVNYFLTKWSTSNVELWADYAAYDHVALCQLWGRMIDLPTGIPMFTNDIQQEAARLGIDRGLPDVPNAQGYPSGVMPTFGAVKHNALYDARVCHARWEFLNEYSAPYNSFEDLD